MTQMSINWNPHCEWQGGHGFVLVGNGDKDKIRVRMKIKLRGGNNVYVCL